MSNPLVVALARSIKSYSKNPEPLELAEWLVRDHNLVQLPRNGKLVHMVVDIAGTRCRLVPEEL